MVATLEQPPSFRHARAGMWAATWLRALSVRATQPASPRLVRPVSVCSLAMLWSSTYDAMTGGRMGTGRQPRKGGSQMLMLYGWKSTAQIERECFSVRA